VPRPPKPRWVNFIPNVTYYKPAGVPMAQLEEVRLSLEELEALRLKDLEGLDQNACAERMKLSQSTFQRILSGARVKLTRAIVEGKAIRIEGGNYQFATGWWICQQCGHRWRSESKLAQDERMCPSCGKDEVREGWHHGPGHGPPPWGRRGRGPR